MHQSIVRNGNHFIRFEKGHHQMYQGKWVLIDGPWYNYLEGIYQGIGKDEVVLQPYRKMSTVSLDCEPSISFPQHSEYIWWERKEIGYYTIGKRLMVQHFEEILHLVEKHKDRSNVYFDPRNYILSKRSVIKAWLCNHGVLPAWLKNEEWDEHLEELFSFTEYSLEELY